MDLRSHESGEVKTTVSESDSALGVGRAALLTGVEDKAGQVRAASGCLQGGGSESQALPREGTGQRGREGARIARRSFCDSKTERGTDSGPFHQ